MMELKFITKLNNYRISLNQRTETEETYNECNELLEHNPIDTKALLERGRAKYSLGDLLGAILDFNSIINLQNQSPEAFSERSWIKIDLGDFHGAIEDSSTALSINPDLAQALWVRGKANRCLNNRDADIELKKAGEKDPHYRYAYSKIDEIITMTMEYVRKIEEINKAIAKVPNDINLYMDRASMKYEENDKSGAIADYTLAIEINSLNFEANFYRGVINREIGKYASAIEDLNRAIEIDSHDKTALLIRGIIKMEQNDFEGAIGDFSNVIRQLRDTKGHNDIEDAMDDSSRVVTIFDDNTILAFSLRAFSKARVKDYLGSVNDYTEVIDHDLHCYDEYRNRGISNCYLKNYKEAISDLTVYFDSFEDDQYPRFYETMTMIENDYEKRAEAFYFRGMAKYSLFDYDGAQADYDLAVKYDPGKGYQNYN